MRKEEADDKKRIIEEAQQILRRDKDNTKSLISALRFSEVKFSNIVGQNNFVLSLLWQAKLR